jgi:hypothetical protein
VNAVISLVVLANIVLLFANLATGAALRRARQLHR